MSLPQQFSIERERIMDLKHLWKTPSPSVTSQTPHSRANFSNGPGCTGKYSVILLISLKKDISDCLDPFSND